MKTFFALIAVLALTVAVNAQQYTSQNFLRSTVGTLTLADNTTTNLPTTVSSDAVLWANPDGSVANAAVVVSVLATNAAGTNTFTFTFRPVHDVGTSGVSNVVDTVRSFTVALAATGTTRATIATNLPTALLQGAKGLRLVTVAVSDEAGNATGMTATAKLAGYVR